MLLLQTSTFFQMQERHGEQSDPRRVRSMFNTRGEREPYWGKVTTTNSSLFLNSLALNSQNLVPKNISNCFENDME